MKFIKKHIYLLSGILGLIIIIISLIVKIKLNNNVVTAVTLESSKEEKIEKENISKENINKTEDCLLYKVDIKGEVNNPGVYQLSEESRVIDVINSAGGLTDKANTTLINLSKKIKDEMVIIIYSNEEVSNSKKDRTITKTIEKECVCPDIKNDSCLNSPSNTSNIEEENQVSKIENKISLKSCTLEELKTVPGLGETKAKSILDYKNQYGFNTVEDLLKVKGIGTTVYEKIKDYFKP
ncbi:comEA protein [Clostridium sp. CAG:762]|nr:comEA protein [Clostridium sp. CAG:762]